MKLFFASFLFSAFSFSLINTTPIKSCVLYEEIIRTIDDLNKITKVGMQSLHSPANIRESCLWSAFKCFVNETLLLKPAHSQKEVLFNTFLSRINCSQSNVRPILCNSGSACDENCDPCANYPKQTEANFLKEFKTLLQRLNQRALMNLECNGRLPTLINTDLACTSKLSQKLNI